jgi:subtilisin family serine protease
VNWRFSAVLLVLVVLLVAVIPVEYVRSTSSADVTSSPKYVPTTRIAADADKNLNGIEDSLEQEALVRSSSSIGQEYVNVTVMLKTEPSADDVAAFVSSGGVLIDSPWIYAIYGFAGRIPYGGIQVFVEQCPDVLLVEEEAICNSSLAYAATQVGARPYAWSNLGLQGDPSSSIALLDTGIDASHIDFSPGYGNQNFSKKIVGWNDQVNSSTTVPYDDEGHGSHCSGLAAGNGFFSTDSSGNAVSTWGANLGTYSSAGTYLVSGMMVNKTGTITISVKWYHNSTSSSSLSALSLFYGDKTLSSGSWTQVASVTTPGQNNFYTLTYNVGSIPSSGYDMYHVLIGVTRGTVGSLFVEFSMSWPYMPPSDGFSTWTGIAQQSKLVGVKVLDYSGSGTSTALISGINWIIANRVAYHITVASMSLGFTSELSSVDSAVLNLVNSGVCAVVAAGNGGSSANFIYTPGSVDEAITVAAMNQFDSIASYSSQGGTSRYTGKSVKPDLTAPGGSFFAAPLFSVDSNLNDADGEWLDVRANDSAPMQGTSMATPMVAGAAEIAAQALGGYAGWNWTRSQALQTKMILLMTATETYPNLREAATSAVSPTLNRGGKDVHEGYGRLNVDAAADAVLKTYQTGTSVSDSLGKPPTLADISVLGQRLAWARNAQLVSGIKYNFTLGVPSRADYDLYLYNTTGNSYGEPVVLANSTSATLGGVENITYTPSLSGEYYVVVKLAREDSGAGQFTLTSEPSQAVNLLLSVQPNQTTHIRGQSVTFAVNVFSQFVQTSESTLTLTITGPSSYYYFDFQRINLVAADASEYSFAWVVPDVAGTYVVEVCLVPAQLTAYDMGWLKVN